MSTSSEFLSLDGARQSMDVLAQHLDDFVAAWEGGADPPELSPFLPAAGEIRRLTLIELIKVDLEYRWLSRHCPKRISEYVAEFPELFAEQVPCDLIYEEFHIRKQSGQPVAAEEYLEAFPKQAAEIASILGIDQPYDSTALYHKRKEQRVEGVSAGDTLDDFDLLAELGTGAFAKVFLARQRSMQRLVALKVSRDQSTEPQMLAQFDHDHIVRVYDQRMLPERNLRLLYMQYVAGGTLHGLLQRVRQTAPEGRSGQLLLDAVDAALEKRGESRPVDSSLRRWLASATWPEAVCWLGTKLSRALDYAHSHGVLHRDVKPANVLLTAEASPKLADFNIGFSSKVAGATPAAYFGGSLAYMSPEQLEACNPSSQRTADELDGRSDFYALGVVLWELLLGCRPFHDDDVSGGWSATIDGMLARRNSGIDVRDLEHVHGCPPGLPAVMKMTLDPDRERRWSSGNEMARRLELCTNRKACDLLFPPPRSLRVLLRRFTVLIVFVTAGLLNVLAGVFNYIYNLDEVIGRLGPQVEPIFQAIQAVINAVSYPVGAVLFWYLGYSVYRGLKRCEAGAAPSPRGQILRRRCVRLGHIIATISIVEWAAAGIVYPVALQLTNGDLPKSAMFHFFFSLLLCGLPAAAYPFFGVTFFSLRSLYPVFVVNDLEGAARDQPMLAEVKRWNSIYLGIAAVAPLLGIAAITVDRRIDPDFLEDAAELYMTVFTAVGLFMLPPAFWLFHSIQSDLQTYSEILGSDEREPKARQLA